MNKDSAVGLRSDGLLPVKEVLIKLFLGYSSAMRNVKETIILILFCAQ